MGVDCGKYTQLSNGYLGVEYGKWVICILLYQDSKYRPFRSTEREACRRHAAASLPRVPLSILPSFGLDNLRWGVSVTASRGRSNSFSVEGRFVTAGHCDNCAFYGGYALLILYLLACVFSESGYSPTWLITLPTLFYLCPFCCLVLSSCRGR